MQGKFGFEVEMRVLVSKRGEPIEPQPAEADDIEESRYDDPGTYLLHHGAAFDMVVDHGSGISDWVGGSGHGRRNNTAIIELVTIPIDEFEAREPEAMDPMEKAADFAGQLEALTHRFTTREKLPQTQDFYVGQRTFPNEQVWQTTDANIQATYGVKLTQISKLASVLSDPNEVLGANQYEAMQNQSMALADGAGKARNLIKVLPQLLKLQQGQPTNFEDLEGLLTLAGTYLAGGRYEQGSGLDKNIVPLLLRHELTEAYAQLSDQTRGILADAGHREKIRTSLLKLHQRGPKDPLFPKTEPTQSQPQCDAWLEAILTGTDAPLQAWFGKAKRIAPEPVGPTDVARPQGVVMEQRSLRTAKSTKLGVARTEWAELARRYYHMLRKMNA
jgi:hypothetical protein